MIYNATAQRFGRQWLVYVPAFGMSRVVANRASAPAAAEEMIRRCGYAVEQFDINVEWKSN